MARTLIEPVDHLPFGSLEKSRRYDSDRYTGAVGLNWYRSDPTLQFLMRMHLSPQGLAWAEPHLDRVGAVMGGPIAARAEETDRNPPRLERYDRWGHERRNRPAADRADGWVRPGRDGDHCHARRRHLAAERVQVVRLQRQWG